MKLAVSKKAIKRSFNIVLLLFCVYILVYLPNSIFGGYWGQPVPGRMEYMPGLSFHSLFLWQPYFGYSDSYNKSPAGLFFYPLILTDQKYIHPPYDLMNTNDAKYLFSKDNHIKWHPESIKDSRRLYLERSVWRSDCVEDREFCLQSAKIIHSKDDVHFMALLINDRFGTNALDRLQSLSEESESEFEKKQIISVIQEVQKLNTKH